MKRAVSIIARKGKTKSAAKAALPAILTPEQQQKLAHYEQIMARFAEMERETTESKREEAEQRTAPVTLSRERMDRVQSAISDINLACASIVRVAFDAGEHACGPVEWHLTAIENVAKTCCMRADVARGLLDDHDRAHFGNFDEQFIVEVAVSEARLADRATEQEGADHGC